MTEQLYYRDSEMSEFEAQIIAVDQEKSLWRVCLDRTCFYPEGGGQPADKGWLNDIPVVNVQKQGDSIYHYLEKSPEPGPVLGKIDRDWRRHFMQQHTGQHIISGSLWTTGQYKTLSVHMGIDYTTIEIDAPEISQVDLFRAEDLANRIIRDNLPLRYIETDSLEIHRFPLRKPTDHSGKIRLVQIGEFDCVGCGGLHLNRTGLVRLVKFTATEKIRDHARITWKIGDKALEDYRNKDQIVSGLKPVVGTREDQLVQKVTGLTGELSSVRKQLSWRESQLADLLAGQLLDKATPQENRPIIVVTYAWKEEEDSFIKKVIKILLKQTGLLLCVVNIKEDNLMWSIGSSQDIPFPFEEYKDRLLPIIHGKGGGRFPLWQGTGLNPLEVDQFFSQFRSIAGLL